MAGVGHNSGTVENEQLRLFIERLERLYEEKKGVQDDITDVFSEMKGQGFDTKITRKILQLRKMEKNDRDEQEALIETYLAALGML